MRQSEQGKEPGQDGAMGQGEELWQDGAGEGPGGNILSELLNY